MGSVMGPQGEKGEQGETGEQGEKGDIGKGIVNIELLKNDNVIENSFPLEGVEDVEVLDRSELPDCGPGTGDENACKNINGCKYDDGECLPDQLENQLNPETAPATETEPTTETAPATE